MELERGTAELYARHAFTQMLDLADRLGDERANERPHGPKTNAPAALVIHCCAVTEFWIGHVALGRPSHRNREEEFSSTATVAELRAMVDATLVQLGDDLAAIDDGRTQPDRTGRQFLEGGDETDGAIVLHVLEELYQHLGHMELAADALMIRG
jgi:DinB superfamily